MSARGLVSVADRHRFDCIIHARMQAHVDALDEASVQQPGRRPRTEG